MNNLNTALADNSNLNNLSLTDIITTLDTIPADKRTFICNNAGGHINHSFIWQTLKHNTTLSNNSPLKSALEHNFGTIDTFKAQFEKAAGTVFGSDWAWLIKKDDGSLKIVTTANQDSPLMPESVVGAEVRGEPVIRLDVWEHAYYLKFRNKRPDYIKAFWEVLDWEEAGRIFEGL